jgi:hypothetical protein
MRKEEVNAILAATTPSLGFYVGFIALAIFAPKAAVFGYLVIALVAVARAPSDRSTAAEIADSA